MLKKSEEHEIKAKTEKKKRGVSKSIICHEEDPDAMFYPMMLYFITA